MTGGEQTVVDVRIVLSGIWVALMLTYLLGDVLRIFSGDADEFMAGGFNGVPVTQGMWLGMAGLMLIPIVMVVLSLTVPYPAIRWITLVAAAGLVPPERRRIAHLSGPLRQVLDRCRAGLQPGDHLVRMDLAPAGLAWTLAGRDTCCLQENGPHGDGCDDSQSEATRRGLREHGYLTISNPSPASAVRSSEISRPPNPSTRS